ncbi:MAG: hypothetical protein PVG61_06470 [Dehalococcoidia bacterium]|jgi:hypothetical protein
MKEDDIRLEYFKHSRFSFEYPEFFNLVDLNLDPGPFIDADISAVYFTSGQGMPYEPSLSIFIVTPEYLEMLNTNDMLDYYLYLYTPEAEEIIRKVMLVAGISADYLKAVETYMGEKMSLRVAIFEHAGLTWEIQMFWYYPEPEPPEVEEYFNHVLETFRILD